MVELFAGFIRDLQLIFLNIYVSVYIYICDYDKYALRCHRWFKPSYSSDYHLACSLNKL